MPLLKEDDAKVIVLEEIISARGKYNFKLFAYVIMPSHVHLVLWPQGGTRIGQVVGDIKALSAMRILEAWQTRNDPVVHKLLIARDQKLKHRFWTPRCYDHNCRSPEIVLEKIRYCHMNPVRAGLVSDAEDWKWSSYRYYLEEPSSIHDIDAIET